MLPGYPFFALRSLFLTFALGIAACSGDELQAPPEEPLEGTMTVDASAGWVYASLAEQGTVTIADPATSTEWDVGLNTTNVVLNGGSAGPAGVTGYCICQNADATDAEILAMTPESELSDFEAMTATTVDPATYSANASPDVFTANPWYKYNLAGDHRISPTFNVYLVKREGSLYKLQLINYYGPAGEVRQVSFRYARLEG